MKENMFIDKCSAYYQFSSVTAVYIC